jgi:hypothetical protein
MDELISKKAVIEAIENNDNFVGGSYDIIKVVKNIPSAEPQIIRCKECKYYGVERTIAIGFYFHVCELLKSTPIRHDDDFCSRGERRTE